MQNWAGNWNYNVATFNLRHQHNYYISVYKRALLQWQAGAHRITLIIMVKLGISRLELNKLNLVQINTVKQ